MENQETGQEFDTAPVLITDLAGEQGSFTRRRTGRRVGKEDFSQGVGRTGVLLKVGKNVAASKIRWCLNRKSSSGLGQH